ncbi:MAG TPA: amino acid adenylation domain-containing protein, partial [Paucimonas sp.]|nr:amino acid adenylation domain-containing protein [Paucimonas sp.]
LDAAGTQRLRIAAQRCGVSAASLCHLAWALVLAHTAGKRDVVFGTVLFGRLQNLEGADRILGPFINTLPLRIDLDGLNAEDGAREMHRRLIELMGHEHASLSLAQRCSGVAAQTPLFTALLNYRNRALLSGDPALAGTAEVEGMERLASGERTNYPVVLDIDDDGVTLGLKAQVSAGLDAELVCGMMRQALEALAQALENEPQRRLAGLDVLPPEERRKILETWNRTDVDDGPFRAVHRLFEDQAAATPDRIAVVCGDEQLSFAELDRKATQLAAHLLEYGGGNPADSPFVGIFMERGLEMSVAVLAVLKAGKAYVPLDPANPDERLAVMLGDARPICVLTQAGHAERLAGLCAANALRMPIKPVVLPALQGDAVLPPCPVHAGSTAYMIYTSGSTGTPKGAMNSHGGLRNRLVWMRRHFQIGAADTILQKTPFGFDVSVWELLLPPMSGARLVYAKPGGHGDPGYLADLIREHRITVAHFVPSMLAVFLGHCERHEQAARLSSLRHVVASGEALGHEQIDAALRLLPATLTNLYGPTEAAIDVTFWRAERLPRERVVPIGRPIANTRIYILDAELRPVAAGVQGELYIGGANVGQGYLGLPQKTAECFLPDPFAGQGKLYRTGDLARFRADGTIEYLGRADHQVKIRGFRIELGEIEARLAAHAEIREAVVLAREDGAGDKRLVAYYVAASDAADPGTEALRSHLRTHLPDYMVPAACVKLERLPLTPNGKLDRKALPDPGAEAYGVRGYVAPQTPIEEALADIWAEILGRERVGVRDNFFELGGHSLMVARVVSKIQDCLEVNVPMRVFFAAPTVEGVLEYVFSELEGAQYAPAADLDSVRV